MSENLEITTGFNRQRRSVLVVSMMLALFLIVGLEITEINVFGNRATLKSPEYAEAVLWIVLGYFLIRYGQFVHDLPSTGLREFYKAKLISLVQKAAEKEFRKITPGIPDDPDIADPKSYSIQIHKKDVLATLPDEWKVRVGASYVYRRTDNSEMGFGTRENIIITNPALRFFKARSILHVGLRTRLGTEYLLPVVFAAVPVVIRLALWLKPLLERPLPPGA